MENNLLAQKNKKLKEMCEMYCAEITQIKADLANVKSLRKKKMDEIE